ncbi:EpsG family protein [Paenibacillus sp. J31TS4]|uniref:EpsG family protein n=1 Tax=Paenibacillus sp. J31TS4 TaxID=2807195 RepID=UPI001BCC0478
MIVYGSALTFICLIAAIFSSRGWGKTSKVIFLFVSFLILFGISGFRAHNIGNDTNSYINFYEIVGYSSLDYLWDFYYEKGFVLLNKYLHIISDNSQVLLITTSFIIISSMMVFIYKNSNIVWLSVYLFIVMMFFYSSMNIMRQYLAMSLLVHSFNFAHRKKPVQFSATILLATLFHKSSIIFGLVYFLNKIKFSYKILCLFSLVVILLFNWFYPFIEYIMIKTNQYGGYTSYFDSNKMGNIINAVVYGMIFVFGLFIKYYKESEPEAVKRENAVRGKGNLLTLIAMITVGIAILSIRMSILGRMVEYFSIFLIIFLPNIISVIKKKSIRIVSIILTVVFFSFYNIIIFVYRPEWYQATPFYFFVN